MDKDQFVDAESGGWWLLERQAEYQILEVREELGKALSRSATEWWTERPKLEEVHVQLPRIAAPGAGSNRERRGSWTHEPRPAEEHAGRLEPGSNKGGETWPIPRPMTPT